MDPRKLQVILEALEAEKSLKAAHGHLPNFGESGLVLNEGDYMMHLRSRELQAFNNRLHIGKSRMMQENRQRKIGRSIFLELSHRRADMAVDLDLGQNLGAQSGLFKHAQTVSCSS